MCTVLATYSHLHRCRASSAAHTTAGLLCTGALCSAPACVMRLAGGQKWGKFSFCPAARGRGNFLSHPENRVPVWRRITARRRFHWQASPTVSSASTLVRPRPAAARRVGPGLHTGTLRAAALGDLAPWQLQRGVSYVDATSSLLGSATICRSLKRMRVSTRPRPCRWRCLWRSRR